jgi:hypothetical protein
MEGTKPKTTKTRANKTQNHMPETFDGTFSCQAVLEQPIKFPKLPLR